MHNTVKIIVQYVATLAEGIVILLIIIGINGFDLKLKNKIFLRGK